MDFRKELAKELGLGAIVENTMLDDYVKACEAIAIRYHDSKVKKLNIPAVSQRSELLAFMSWYNCSEQQYLRGWSSDVVVREYLKANCG